MKSLHVLSKQPTLRACYEYFQAQGDNSSWLCPTCTDKQSNTSTSSVNSDSSGPDQTHVSHTPPAQGKQFERVKIAVLNTASIKGHKKAGEFKAYHDAGNGLKDPTAPIST